MVLLVPIGFRMVLLVSVGVGIVLLVSIGFRIVLLVSIVIVFEIKFDPIRLTYTSSRLSLYIEMVAAVELVSMEPMIPPP